MAVLHVAARRRRANQGTGPGSATALKWVVEPARAVHTAVVFYKPAVVQLSDADGRSVRRASVPITVAISSGGGTLTGTTTVNTGRSGRAEFQDLVITGTAGSRTLDFTSAGLTTKQATVGVFAVTATYTIADTANVDTNGLNLQTQIDTSAAANESAVINLVAGVTYRRTVGFRARVQSAGTGPMVIKSNGTLPAAGTRLVPSTDGAQMAKLLTNGNQTWVLGMQAGAHDYVFLGIDFSMAQGAGQTAESPQLIQVGSFDPTNDTSMTPTQKLATLGTIFRHCFLHPPEATQAARNDTLLSTVNDGVDVESSASFIDSDLSGFAPNGKFSGTPDSPRRTSIMVAGPGPLEKFNCYLEANYTAACFLGGGDAPAQNTSVVTASTLGASTGTLTISDITNLSVGNWMAWNTGFAGQNYAFNVGTVDSITGAGPYVVTFTIKDHRTTGAAKTATNGGTAQWRTSTSAVGSATISVPTTTTMTLSSVTGIIVGTKLLAPINDGSGQYVVYSITVIAGNDLTFTQDIYGANLCFVPPLITNGTARWNGYLWPANVRIAKCKVTNRPAWAGAGGTYMKGFFENKSCTNFLFDGNVCFATPFNDAGTWTGSVFAWVTYNQDGSAPWTTHQNSHMGACWATGMRTDGVFLTQGGDPYNVTDQTSGKFFKDNMVIEEPPGHPTGACLFSTAGMRAIDPMEIDHITLLNTGVLAKYGSTNPATVKLQVNNSIAREGSDANGGALCFISPNGFANCYPASDWKKNIIVNPGANPNNGSYGAFESGTQRVTAFSGVGFTDLAGRDYRLTGASIGKNAATDGKDIGADIGVIYDACNPLDWPAGVPVP